MIHPIFLLGVLSASLLGSWHCAGMCGPFAALLARLEGPRWKLLLAYQLGRLATYLALGTAIHSVGLQFRSLFHALGIPTWGVALFVGTLYLWSGLLAFGSLPRWNWLRNLSIKLTNHVAAWNRQAYPLGGASAAFVVGSTTTLLPCMWLYGYFAVSAYQPRLYQAWAVLLVFWMGNIPWLLASQSVLHWIHRNLRGWSRPLGAVFLATLMAYSAYKTLPRLDKTDIVPGRGNDPHACCRPK